MDMILGFILMFGIAMILCVGCWLANGTQDFIDEQNERIRKSEYNKRQQMYGDQNAK